MERPVTEIIRELKRPNDPYKRDLNVIREGVMWCIQRLNKKGEVVTESVPIVEEPKAKNRKKKDAPDQV